VAPPCPPFSTTMSSSIASPASALPFPLPSLQPTSSSSIVTSFTNRWAAAVGETLISSSYGRYSAAVTVIDIAPVVSGVNESVTCPEASVTPVA